MRTTITITLDTTAEDRATLVKRVMPHLPVYDTPATTEAWGILRSLLLAQNDPAECVAIEHKRGWIAGWNIPGYLPDVEVMTFESWSEAGDMLIDELTRAKHERLDALNNDMQRVDRAFAAEQHKILKTYDPALAAIARRMVEVRDGAKPEPFWVQCGRHVWWIAEEQ